MQGTAQKNPLLELKAKPGCCEEAATTSHFFYIPCDQPATRIVSFISRGEGPYRMCDACAWHNTKNRGATDIGPHDPKAIRNPVKSPQQ